MKPLMVWCDECDGYVNPVCHSHASFGNWLLGLLLVIGVVSLLLVFA